MFVMEHLIMEDTVYLYNRNLNKVVHLHIMILKLASNNLYLRFAHQKRALDKATSPANLLAVGSSHGTM